MSASFFLIQKVSEGRSAAHLATGDKFNIHPLMQRGHGEIKALDGIGKAGALHLEEMCLPRQVRDHIAAIGRRREFFVIQKDRDIRWAADNHSLHAHEIPASEAADHNNKQKNQHDGAEWAAARLRWLVSGLRSVSLQSRLWGCCLH